jgi:PAS domain S-box-containing protein
MGTGLAGLISSRRNPQPRLDNLVALFWNSQQRPVWVRYGVALALVTIAAGCNYIMPPVYGQSHYFFFSVAILATALVGGIGPGFLATTVSALLSAYLFIAPYQNIRIEAPEAAERLAMFVIEGVIISSVGHVIRENRTPELVSFWSRYGAAFVLVAGAGVLKLILFPSLEQRVPFTFFYSAIVATVWVAGAGPGLIATALATACSYLLFFHHEPESASGNPSLVLFAFEATALCLLNAIYRQRLLETEAHLGRVFEDSPTGILIVEKDAKILRANPAFRHMLRDDSHIEGRPLTELVHPDSRERVRRFLGNLDGQQSATAEEVCFLLDSNTAWTNLSRSLIRETGNHIKTCLVMVEDITERRRTEEALRNTETRLERGQRIEAIGMFAGGIAHDFNNLLTVIFACCERMLFEEDLPADVRRCTEEILQTAKTAADLTRQLLTFARRQPHRDQAVQINQVVRESATMLQRLIGARINLRTDLAADAGAVRADPSQLQQILMNLAANARDAMPSGGRLTIQTSQITVAASGAGDAGPAAKQYVVLEVADTGHGMDEETRARIFEPTFSTKELEEGAGLGLATVQSIVTKLGGFIGVESSPGEGARFCIHLPSLETDAGDRRKETSWAKDRDEAGDRVRNAADRDALG